MYRLDDTIAAIASPPGGAARGIVRLSGPGIRRCLEDFFRPEPFCPLFSLTAATALPGVLWLPGIAAPLPGDLYLWPTTRSYTGQPVAEIHTFGSPPLLESLLRAACQAGARPAEPGEFTLRAFLAGRLDLTQAEAVLGVIDATAAEDLSTALIQLAGGLAGPLHRLRDELLDLLAHLEAGFDFADEDLPFLTSDQLLKGLDSAAVEIEQLRARMTVRGEAAPRISVVLVGRPNSGKSSLFNALVARTGAIVSDQPGTTRDYLMAEIDLDGVRCQLIDTAGVEVRSPGLSRQPNGESPKVATTDGSRLPEAEIALSAQDVMREQERRARVHVLCLDGARQPDAWEIEASSGDPRFDRVVVLTKADLSPSASDNSIRTSAVTGAGLPALRAALRAAVLQATGPRGDVVAGTAVRCGESLRLAAECLVRARQMALDGGGEELIAAELRAALEEIGKVAGTVYTDDVLDRIFSRFCIGK